MNEKYTPPQNIKTFLSTLLIFHGAYLSLIIGAIIFQQLEDFFLGFVFAYLSELLGTIWMFVQLIAAFLAIVWLVVTFIWCLIIRKKEKSNKIFAHPLTLGAFAVTFIHMLTVLFIYH